VSLLKPTDYQIKVEDIDLQKLIREGRKNLIIDIEGTIVPRKTWELLPEKLNWIQGAREKGFKIVLLSNTFFRKEARKISEAAGAPAIHAAFKPFPRSFRKSLRLLGGTASDSVMVGDQLFTDVLGGNIAGLYTIMVEPIAGEQKLSRKFMKWLEGLFFKPAP
jgi:HAD superfamily phosphatase (TIGR01668 family)